MSANGKFAGFFASGPDPTTGQVILNFILFTGLVVVALAVAGSILYLISVPMIPSEQEGESNETTEEGGVKGVGDEGKSEEEEEEEEEKPGKGKGGKGKGGEGDIKEEKGKGGGEEGGKGGEEGGKDEEEEGKEEEGEGGDGECGEGKVPVEEFDEECLKAHNDYRDKHDVPHLVQDEKVKSTAMKYAKKTAGNPSAGHNMEILGTYGENIYGDSGMRKCAVSCTAAVDAWYEEIKDFDDASYGKDFGGSSPPPHTGHYTQVIWKSTKKLGCGFSYGNDWTTVICNYEPPGNNLREYSKNVFKPD